MNDLNLRSCQLRATELSPNQMLDYARRENPPSSTDSDSLLPVWVLKKNNRLKLLWKPRGRKLEGEIDAVLVRSGGRSQPGIETLTLKVWKRLDVISPLEKGFLIDFKGIDPSEPLEVEQRRFCDEKLNVPAATEWIETYLFLLTLPATLKQELHENSQSPGLYRHLKNLPEEILDLLLPEIAGDRLDLTVQMARRLAEAFLRLGEPSPELCEELKQSDEFDGSGRARGKRLLGLAESLAYPELTRHQAQFENRVKTLELDGRLAVQPPKNFEGDWLNFSFRCARGEDLQPLLESIRRSQELFSFV